MADRRGAARTARDLPFGEQASSLDERAQAARCHREASGGTPGVLARARWVLLRLAVVGFLLGSSCLPGHRTKEIRVTNQCQGTVWLRFTDQPNATQDQMLERKAYEAMAGGLTTVRGSVLAPPDGRQGSMAVSSTADLVGSIVPLPKPVNDETHVLVSGDLCPT